MKTLGPFVVALLLPLGALQAQDPDSAWTAGDYAGARAGYLEGIQADPGNTRAWYRLGILLSWEGRLDSALVMLRTARDLEPGDFDIRLAEARILSWAGRTDEADSVYAWVLEQDPDNAAAGAGRAQLKAWDGNLQAAIDDYLAVLSRHPDDPDALTGLGQVYLWQGRVTPARTMATRALAASPTHRGAQELTREINRTTRPQPELTLGWSHDSDDNTSWWQTATAGMMLRDRVRGFASLSALEASDPIRNAQRLGLEAGMTFPAGQFRLTTALGLRLLSPDTGPGRTEPTWRISTGFRLTGAATASVNYAHFPFDETALLIGRNLDVDALDAGLEVAVRPRLDLSAGAGAAWFSDGNARLSGVLALMHQVGSHAQAGVFGRMMGYTRAGFGYFTPGRYTLVEARGSWSPPVPSWTLRLSGGLGIQQVEQGASVQSEWHLEGRAGREWGSDDYAEAFAGITNSAASSTTGAFRYYTAGVTIRITW